MTDQPCSVCLGHHTDSPFCRNCFQVWYDSGVLCGEHLAAECKARKYGGFWPWGAGDMPTAQIDAIAKQFLHGYDK